VRAGTARAWVVWSAGLAAYVVAVLDRTSFGVAGLAAADRFAATASVVATFAVFQLVMYAGLQVPVGVLLDRFGSRALLVTGSLVMAAGQAGLALATSVPPALLGRGLVGAGDAMIFVSVLRLVPAWFPARRVPVMSQFTGLAGQLGQVLSAVPLVALLENRGWQTAFLSAAAASVGGAVVVALLVHDRPDAAVARGAPIRPERVQADLLKAWRHPGTRLGLWTHFTTQFPGTVFALMWGYPFLVSGEGLSPATAGTMLTVFVAAGVAAGPFMGVMVARHPLRRSWLVLGVVAVNVAGWTLVLAWPGRAPTEALLLLVLAMAVGGPGSMIGFDFARTFNPPNRLGTATGIVNVGGFVASLVTILLVGLVLDRRTGGSAGYDLPGFKVALATMYPMWAVGLTGILVTRRKVRRRMAAGGVVVPPIRDVIAQRRRAGRRLL